MLPELHRAHAKLVRSAFRLLLIARPRLLLRPRLRILFSDSMPGWREMIETGFRYTGHEVEFAPLADSDLDQHDLVVPLTIADTTWLLGTQPGLARNPLPLPSLECLRLCDDKARLNRALAERGFGDLIPTMGGALPFPDLVKKRIDESSVNTHVVANPQDERRLEELLASPDYFSQELVAGREEYATHILFQGGAIACSLTLEYVFDTPTPVKGQNPFTDRTLTRCRFLDEFTAILGSIGFEGLCCLNYKVRDGRPLLFEINPRFGGSLSPYFAWFVEHLGRGTPRPLRLGRGALRGSSRPSASSTR
jgi:hypothetical protein